MPRQSYPAYLPGVVQALHHLAKGAFAQVAHDLIYEREEAGRESLDSRRGGSSCKSTAFKFSETKKASLSLLHS